MMKIFPEKRRSQVQFKLFFFVQRKVFKHLFARGVWHQSTAPPMNLSSTCLKSSRGRRNARPAVLMTMVCLQAIFFIPVCPLLLHYYKSD